MKDGQAAVGLGLQQANSSPTSTTVGELLQRTTLELHSFVGLLGCDLQLRGTDTRRDEAR